MREVSGRASTGPKDVLFAKWKDNWNEIKAEMTEQDELNVFDWESAEGSAVAVVAQGVKDWAIYATEQKHFGKRCFDGWSVGEGGWKHLRRHFKVFFDGSIVVMARSFFSPNVYVYSFPRLQESQQF